MEGTVYAINSQSGLVAVDTASGFSIFEQTSSDFEIGDFVSWTSDHPIGACEVRNISRSRMCTVYFQNHQVPGAFLKVNLQL